MSLIRAIKERVKREEPFTDAANHFVYQRKGEKEPIFYFNSVCFASLMRTGKPVQHLRLYINQHKPYIKKGIYRYWKWVMHESPWAGAFLNKSYTHKKFLAEGIKMNTGMPSVYVVGAMCALRHSWEFPLFLDSWYFFQKKGLSKELSFILANISDLKGNTHVPNSNHATFERGKVGKQTLHNFKARRKEVSLFNVPPMEEKLSSYRGIFDLFNPEKSFYSTELLDLLLAYSIQEGKGWAARSVILWSNRQLIISLKEWDK